MKKRAWSFSALTLYEGCPQKYKLKYIDKLPEPVPEEDNPMVRGNRIHSNIEDYLQHDVTLSNEIKIVDYIRDVKVKNPIVEEDWAYTEDWEVTGWSEDNTDCRMKLDAFIKDGTHCHIIDWKTGKDYPIKRIAQGQLYTIGALKRFPELETFHVDFAYTDQGTIKSSNYKLKQIPKFEANYKRRVDTMRNDTKFKAVNNKWNCKFCPFGPDNMNSCDYGVTE
ncbi:MAG TPA: hypothetical protein EYQ00_07285 [Dehalococcoidia bacterium]|nr:hypothetical protein [Dehalococcoidia bacterium]